MAPVVSLKSSAPEITLGQDSEINISALRGTGDAGELTIAGTSLILDNSLIATETLTVGECRTGYFDGRYN